MPDTPNDSSFGGGGGVTGGGPVTLNDNSLGGSVVAGGGLVTFIDDSTNGGVVTVGTPCSATVDSWFVPPGDVDIYNTTKKSKIVR